jgi:hypothetical protein
MKFNKTQKIQFYSEALFEKKKSFYSNLEKEIIESNKDFEEPIMESKE